MQAIWIILGLLVGGGVGAGIAYYILKPRTEQEYAQVEAELKETRRQADSDAEKLLDDAKKEARQIRVEAEQVAERRYQDLQRAEERIDRRSEKLDKQNRQLESREQVLNKRQSRLDRKQNEINKMEGDHRAKLEEIASMTSDEAQQQLLAEVEKEARQDMARVMREIEDRAKETAEEKARGLIAMAIQRVASDQVSDITVSVVPLPGDEMKGRIIGRNGRNIRAFEQAAGVDIVVDDTPRIRHCFQFRSSSSGDCPPSHG